MFGQAWQEELHYGKNGTPKVNFGLTFGLSALLHLVATLVFAFLLGTNAGALKGTMPGLAIGAGLVELAIAVTYIIANDPSGFFLSMLASMSYSLLLQNSFSVVGKPFCFATGISF